MRILQHITMFVAIASMATTLFAQKVAFDKDEFDYVFSKNSRVNNLYTPREDYLTLYVNYKLKVQEARAIGLDTLSSYKKECLAYKKELIAPFWVDSAAIESYKRTIGERINKRIHASHVLVPVAPDASPEDTLLAYNKIFSIRDSLVKIGGPHKVNRRNSGSIVGGVIEEDLGYFTTLSMVAPFEEAAYATPVGQYSSVLRTQFGYHIMYIHDVKPSKQILVAHIMKMYSDSIRFATPEALAIMDTVMMRLRKGDAFEDLAKQYSDDQQSAVNGGQMPWLYEDTNIPGFMQAALQLKNKGDLSGVVTSPFGLHIIKLLDERSTIPGDMMNRLYRELLNKDKVRALSCSAIASRMSKKMKAKVNANAFNELMEIVLSTQTDSLKQVKIDAIAQPLLYIDKKNVMAKDVDIDPSILSNQTPSEYKEALIEHILCDMYEEQLPSENKQYKYTLAEYYDGPLVYEMNIQQVWQKQPSDSIVISQLYASNPARYSKGGKFSGRIYVCDNSRDADKVRKAVERGKDVDKKLYVELIEGDQQQGELYDDYLWPFVKSGCIVIDGQYTEGQRLDIELAKQMLQADLIAYREREFAQKLRKKYKVESNPKL